MIRATRETTVRQRYLDLQRAAQNSKRPTDELIQLFALECFLDRLTHSRFAKHFVLNLLNILIAGKVAITPL